MRRSPLRILSTIRIITLHSLHAMGKRFLRADTALTPVTVALDWHTLMIFLYSVTS